MLIDSDTLLQALEIFVVGWGGIFVVMGVLYGVIKLLLKTFPKKKNKPMQKDH